MKTIKFYLPFVVLAIVLLGLTSCDEYSCNSHVSKIVELETEMADNMTFDAHTSHSHINVIGTEENTCYVKAKVNVYARTTEEANEIIQKVEVQLEKSGDKITAVVDKPEIKNNCGGVFVAYDVKLPKKTSVVLKTTHDPINIENLEGSVNAATSHDPITCRDIVGDLKLHSSHDPITLSNIKGDIYAHTSHDSIIVDNATGNLDIHTSHGAIRIDNVTGNIYANTSHNSINVENTKGNLKLRTSHDPVFCKNIDTSLLDVWTSHDNVSISFIDGLENELDCSVETSHGNIWFDLPESFAGSINMSTTHGKVKSNVPITVQGLISEEKIIGTIGNGTGKVNLKTTHGSIDLK